MAGRGGRNDAALAAAMQAVADAIGTDGNAAARGLATFQKEKPPVFKGRYDPEGALAWLKEIERIFRVMDCNPAQKLRFGVHQLSGEADDWWVSTLRRLENVGGELSWNVFRREFLRKYFSENARGKKEMEFLNLTQGNGSVSEYAAKFEELVQFHPHYNDVDSEFSKCIKFEEGLRHDIQKAMTCQQIRRYDDLVDRCRIFEEASNKSYKIVKEKRDKSQDRSKPYEVSGGKDKQKVAAGAGSGKKPSGGDASAPVVCYKCGRPGHKSFECPGEERRCYKCGKGGHMAAECDRKDVVCYNCGEAGHISPKCTKPKKEKGKVFVLAGSGVADEILGMCLCCVFCLHA